MATIVAIFYRCIILEKNSRFVSMYKLKSCVLFMLILLMYTVAQAQRKIKLYSNFEFRSTLLLDGAYNSNTAFQFYFQKPIFFSVAFQKMKGEAYIEYELSKINFSNSGDLVYNYNGTGAYSFLSGHKIYTSQLAFRIEKGKKFYTNKKLAVLLGYGIQPFFESLKAVPYLTTQFPSSVAKVGLNLNVVPRVNYYIANKISIDLNVPLQCLGVAEEFYNFKNPTLPISLNRFNAFSANFPFLKNLPPVRLGISYTL